MVDEEEILSEVAIGLLKEQRQQKIVARGMHNRKATRRGRVSTLRTPASLMSRKERKEYIKPGKLITYYIPKGRDIKMFTTFKQNEVNLGLKEAATASVLPTEPNEATTTVEPIVPPYEVMKTMDKQELHNLLWELSGNHSDTWIAQQSGIDKNKPHWIAALRASVGIRKMNRERMTEEEFFRKQRELNQSRNRENQENTGTGEESTLATENLNQCANDLPEPKEQVTFNISGVSSIKDIIDKLKTVGLLLGEGEDAKITFNFKTLSPNLPE